MSTTLRSLFGTALDNFRDRPAVTFDGTVTTYAQLADSANRLAHVLVAAGVSPGTPVALMMGNRTEWVIADQAIIRAGGAKVPVNDMLAGPEIEYVLRDSGAVVALADEKLAPLARAAGVPRVIEVGDAWDAALSAAPADGSPAVEVTERDIGVIMYTGGTTGRQRGVVHTQRGLALNILAHVVEMGLADDERLLITAPLPHSAGFLTQAGLLKGCHHLLEAGFDAEIVLDRIHHDRTTFLFMVPTMIYRILDAAERRAAEHREVDLSSLRTILYGAASISRRRLEQGIRRFGPVFMQFYGQSEAPNFLTWLSREDHDPDRPELLRSCGRPVTMVDIAVLDDEGAPVPAGEIGEICGRASYTMAGYHGLPDKTAETLRGGWLHTRDVGRIDADGYLHLLDRTSDMMISGGLNVYSTEVENVLAACPGVGQVAVTGVPHPDWGEAVVAFVVPDHDGFDETATMAHCRTQLGAYKCPKAFRLLDVLPVTAFGKVDKKALRADWPGW